MRECDDAKQSDCRKEKETSCDLKVGLKGSWKEGLGPGGTLYIMEDLKFYITLCSVGCV